MTYIFCNAIETHCLRKVVGTKRGGPSKPFIPHMLLAQACRNQLTCLWRQFKTFIVKEMNQFPRCWSLQVISFICIDFKGTNPNIEIIRGKKLMCVGFVMKMLTMMQTLYLEKLNYVNLLTRNLCVNERNMWSCSNITWNQLIEQRMQGHLKDISHNIMCKFIVVCAFQKVDVQWVDGLCAHEMKKVYH